LKRDIDSVVGVWEVRAPHAPFQWHMMTFTPYGTMSQSNPHEGNRDESDSSGQGVWQLEKTPDGKDQIVGKFVEFKADRTTGKYIGKGVISFTFTVNGDSFEGTTDAYRYNAEGKIIKGPLVSPITGTRVTLDESNNSYMREN
jgi:predicted secreted protein